MRTLSLLLMLLVLVLVACGNQADAGNASIPDPADIGNPDTGRQIFSEWHGEAPACSTCHTIDGTASVGPSLKGITSRAGRQVDGMDAVAYLHESIVDPNAFVADGKAQSVMYKHFGEVLTEEQIRDLIAYLLMLE
ncbi:MAG: c-type cytochrome [Chloroflexi bacterium]|nr:c-type cytochrome [Chloroflexota bacterium]